MQAAAAIGGKWIASGIIIKLKMSELENNEPHTDEQEEGYGDEQQQNEDEEEMYQNNHDLVGVDGIIRAQKNEIEKKKVRFG